MEVRANVRIEGRRLDWLQSPDGCSVGDVLGCDPEFLNPRSAIIVNCKQAPEYFKRTNYSS